MPRFINRNAQKYLKGFILFLLAITLILTSLVAYQRIGVFGCFDQCPTFVVAYFMLKGKILYKQIFFNHQPLIVYLSYFIQLISRPQTIYQLVLYHRMFIFLLFLLMDAFLILRFRWAGIGFVLFYETTKYYLLGYFFLPETIIPYFAACLVGLWWEKKNLALIDYLIAGFSTWLILFFRMPYFPMAFALYLLILLPINKKTKPSVVSSLLLFSLLSLLVILFVPLNDYLYDLLSVNLKMMTDEAKALEMNGPGVLKIFLYPFLIFLIEKRNYFWSAVTGLDAFFLILVFWRILKFRKAKETLSLFLFLGLAAIRYVKPGTTFYEAFHLLPWYGLFLMASFLILLELIKNEKNRVYSYSLLTSLGILFVYIILSPQSVFWEKINREEEFTINYAHYFAHGQVIKILSRPEDTLFLELWDDLIYWQSGLDSPYQYSLYTPPMATSQKFNQARLAMFRHQPPDFYYSYRDASENCSFLLPNNRKNDYLQLYFAGKPDCLYLKKTKLDEISSNQWEEVKKLGFHLSETPN